MTSASLFASRMRLPARAAASVGRSPAAPTIAATTVSTPGQARGFEEPRLAGQHVRGKTGSRQCPFELGGSLGIRHDGNVRSMSRAKLGELFPLRVRGERGDFEAIGMPRDDVERGIADRAGRAENADASRAHRR